MSHLRLSYQQREYNCLWGKECCIHLPVCGLQLLTTKSPSKVCSCIYFCLGLLLGTEAPVMTPNGIDFSFLFLTYLWPLLDRCSGLLLPVHGRRCLFVSTFAPIPEQMAAFLMQGVAAWSTGHMSACLMPMQLWVTAVSTVVTEVWRCVARYVLSGGLPQDCIHAGSLSKRITT